MSGPARMNMPLMNSLELKNSFDLLYDNVRVYYKIKPVY